MGQAMEMMAAFSPATGDISQWLLFAIIGGVALAAIVVCAVLSKKSKK